MSGVSVIRLIFGTIGVLMLLGGVALALAGGGLGMFIPVLWLMASGTLLVVVALLEVSRYRSEAAERDRVPPGPGGGESAPLEPRFKPTGEVFVDPSSRRTMRVFADRATGERRYIADE